MRLHVILICVGRNIDKLQREAYGIDRPYWTDSVLSALCRSLIIQTHGDDFLE